MLVTYSAKFISAFLRVFSRIMLSIGSVGKRDAEQWDDSDVPEIKIFQKKTKDGKLVDWLTPEKLFVRQDILILSLDAPAPHEGLVARCYADGQLQFLGFYKDGTCDYYWSMTLEYGVETGCAKRYPSANEEPVYEEFNDGCSIRYDAWSDNSGRYEIDYDVWVRGWVKRIAGDVKAR
jgi:hypothetical protein